MCVIIPSVSVDPYNTHIVDIISPFNEENRLLFYSNGIRQTPSKKIVMYFLVAGNIVNIHTIDKISFSNLNYEIYRKFGNGILCDCERDGRSVTDGFRRKIDQWMVESYDHRNFIDNYKEYVDSQYLIDFEQQALPVLKNEGPQDIKIQNLSVVCATYTPDTENKNKKFKEITIEYNTSGDLILIPLAHELNNSRKYRYDVQFFIEGATLEDPVLLKMYSLFKLIYDNEEKVCKGSLPIALRLHDLCQLCNVDRKIVELYDLLLPPQERQVNDFGLEFLLSAKAKLVASTTYSYNRNNVFGKIQTTIDENLNLYCKISNEYQKKVFYNKHADLMKY